MRGASPGVLAVVCWSPCTSITTRSSLMSSWTRRSCVCVLHPRELRRVMVCSPMQMRRPWLVRRVVHRQGRGGTSCRGVWMWTPWTDSSPRALTSRLRDLGWMMDLLGRCERDMAATTCPWLRRTYLCGGWVCRRCACPWSCRDGGATWTQAPRETRRL